MNWYVLFVESGFEDNVKKLICKRFNSSEVECCIPKRVVLERKFGQLSPTVKTIFPGYVFIKLNMNFNNYYLMKSIPRIIKLLNYTNKKDKKLNFYGDHEHYFRKIPSNEMANVLKLINFNGLLECPQILFRKNKFSVLSGPLKGQENNIVKINKSKNRAKISVNFMGEDILIDIGIKIIPMRKIGQHQLQKGGFVFMNTRQQVEEIIRKVLELPENNVLMEELDGIGVNSLKFVHIIVELENHFNFEYPDEYLYDGKLPTITDLVNFIKTISLSENSNTWNL
ncbi:antiterminator LoaP [Paenibacillus pabuli]|uniref:antiterminator LoaP n=1 Tax=Paenibacillus pabuli TaxID=1472 RepID=UPI003CEFB9C5